MKYALLQKDDISKYEGYINYLTEDEIKDSSVQFMGAFNDENALCAVAAFTAEREAYLLGVYVAESMLRQGVGSSLLESVYDLLRRNGGQRIITVVSSESGDYQGYGNFLWRCGLNEGAEYFSGTAKIKVAVDSPILSKARAKDKNNSNLVTLNDVSEEIFSWQWDKSSKESDVAFPSFDSNIIDREISTVLYEDNQINGWVLLGKDSDGITIEHIYLSPVVKDRALLISMLGVSLDRLIEKYPNEEYINAVFLGDDSKKLFTTVFGENASLESQKMYYMNFDKTIEEQVLGETEASMIDIEEVALEDDLAAEDNRQDIEDVEASGSFSEDPVFELLTNENMICKDCIYCDSLMVSSCHKYDIKPEDILNGEDNCPHYHA